MSPHGIQKELIIGDEAKKRIKNEPSLIPGWLLVLSTRIENLKEKNV